MSLVSHLTTSRDEPVKAPMKPASETPSARRKGKARGEDQRRVGSTESRANSRIGMEAAMIAAGGTPKHKAHLQSFPSFFHISLICQMC